MVEMKKGELKQAIEKLLNERGPMTSSQISEALEVELRDVVGAMKTMSIEGRVYPLKRDRKTSNVWMVSGWMK